jgi:hypothetical protein
MTSAHTSQKLKKERLNMPIPEIKAESPTLPLPPPRAVRITMPAAVAYNLEALERSIVHLVARLGHPQCFSGVDCTFLQERDFIINEEGEVRASKDNPNPSPWLTFTRYQGPQPDPWRLATATLPASVSNDLEQIRGVVANVAGKLGCPGCCSGFDILFRQELDFVVNEAGEVRG